jgi:hypothetical protein
MFYFWGMAAKQPAYDFFCASRWIVRYVAGAAHVGFTSKMLQACLVAVRHDPKLVMLLTLKRMPKKGENVHEFMTSGDVTFNATNWRLLEIAIKAFGSNFHGCADRVNKWAVCYEGTVYGAVPESRMLALETLYASTKKDDAGIQLLNKAVKALHEQSAEVYRKFANEISRTYF